VCRGWNLAKKPVLRGALFYSYRYFRSALGLENCLDGDCAHFLSIAVNIRSANSRKADIGGIGFSRAGENTDDGAQFKEGGRTKKGQSSVAEIIG
jgi:hypothetical protein